MVNKLSTIVIKSSVTDYDRMLQINKKIFLPQTTKNQKYIIKIGKIAQKIC